MAKHLALYHLNEVCPFRSIHPQVRVKFRECVNNLKSHF
jgi:hypothetical protein